MSTIFAYFAGIVDGEGWISLEKRGRSMIAYVGVANAHKQVLVSMQEIFGGSIKPGNKVNHQVWVYRVSQRKAEAMLKLLRPYMRIKVAEADIVLEYLERTKITKGRVPDSELNMRLDYRKRLRASRYQFAEER